MQRPLFSIIIPVYNAAATLTSAVESILNQSEPDFELLLVDDGSQDTSADLCRQLAVRDSRIRVFSQKNGGICAARNRGLTEACGEYIGFCDDDDLYLPGSLQTAKQILKDTGADFVRGGYELLRETASGQMVQLPHAPGIACRLPAGKDGKAYLTFLTNAGPQFVWNAFYKRDLLGDIRFDEQCRFGLEDFLFNSYVYAKDSVAVYTPFPFYRHYERGDSTSAATAKAVEGRIQTVSVWVQAEYTAAQARSTSCDFRDVWAVRKAEFVTFLMHQLRDSHAGPDICRSAWNCLRQACRHTTGCNGGLDFLRAARHNKKQAIALFLYTAHLQAFYAHLPNKEEKLLK